MPDIPIQDILFFVLAGIIVVFGLLVVVVKNLLHAALALIAAFFGTAGLYILLNAEFAALAQVAAYIGGVVIFIVFAILLTSKLGEKFLNPGPFKSGTAVAIALGLFIFISGLLTKGLLSSPVPPGHSVSSPEMGSLKAVGTRFLDFSSSGFIIPFEIISILLLTVFIGAVTIARKEEGEDSERA